MTGERWKEVTKANPCPACGKPDWCAWTPDGMMLKCERTQNAPPGMVLVKAIDGGALFRRDDGTAINSCVPAPQPTKPGNAHARTVATYDYRDSAGALLFQVVRFDPKAFRQRRPDENGGCSDQFGTTDWPATR